MLFLVGWIDEVDCGLMGFLCVQKILLGWVGVRLVECGGVKVWELGVYLAFKGVCGCGYSVGRGKGFKLFLVGFCEVENKAIEGFKKSCEQISEVVHKL